MLAPFIRFLDESGLIDFENVDDEEGFETRFKIQKYVYLSEHFGLENPYRYTMYRYGPYSSSLADDYYELGENHELLIAQAEEPLSESFDREGFLNLVNGKNTDWLEISTTLIDQSPRFNDDDDLINHVENIKCNYANEYIRNVLRELQAQEIL